jgi:hypothetical protein
LVNKWKCVKPISGCIGVGCVIVAGVGLTPFNCPMVSSHGPNFIRVNGQRKPLKVAEVAKTATNKRSSKRASVKVKSTASSKVR